MNERTPPKPTRKIPLSDLIIGPARGGDMDRLLLTTKGQTLREWIRTQHKWVKP
jgi:hypothetical protein